MGDPPLPEPSAQGPRPNSSPEAVRPAGPPSRASPTDARPLLGAVRLRAHSRRPWQRPHSPAPPPRQGGAGPRGAPPQRHGTSPALASRPPLPNRPRARQRLTLAPALPMPVKLCQTPTTSLLSPPHCTRQPNPATRPPASHASPIFSQPQPRSTSLVSTRPPRLSAGDCENSSESRPSLPSQTLHATKNLSGEH